MPEPRTYPEGVTSWVDVEVPDLEAAQAFYGGLFGWTFEQVSPDGARRTSSPSWTARTSPGSPATGARRRGTPTSPSTTPTRSRRGSAQHGGRVRHRPAPAGDAGRYAACADPAGVPFRLWQAGARPGAQVVNAPGSLELQRPRTPPTPTRPPASTRAVFGWAVDDLGFGSMIRRPGYGDHLAATIDPGIHERQAGVSAPPGFADAIGWLAPAEPDETPHWHVVVHRRRPRRDRRRRRAARRHRAPPYRHRLDPRRAGPRPAGRRCSRPASSRRPPRVRDMEVDLFACLYVRDRDAVQPWYERLLGSEPSFYPNDTEAVFDLAEHRYLYIEQSPEHAGHSQVTVFVGGLRRADRRHHRARASSPRARRPTTTACARRRTSTPTATGSGSAETRPSSPSRLRACSVEFETRTWRRYRPCAEARDMFFEVVVKFESQDRLDATTSKAIDGWAGLATHHQPPWTRGWDAMGETTTMTYTPAHARRGVADSAAYLRDRLTPGTDVLDVGSGPGQHHHRDPAAGGAGPGRGGRGRRGGVAAGPRGRRGAGFRRRVRARRRLRPRLPRRDVRRGARPSGDAPPRRPGGRAPGDGAGVPARRDRRRPRDRLRRDDVVPRAARDRDWLATYRRSRGSTAPKPDAGRRLVSWARQAGFTDVRPSASVWLFATPEEREFWGGGWARRTVESDFARQAVDQGLATEDRLREMSAAWRAWADDEGGWFAVLHGEVILGRLTAALRLRPGRSPGARRRWRRRPAPSGPACRPLAVAPEPLALAERDRVDEQVQVVDQALGQQRADQLAAAGDVDDAVPLLLEPTDRVRVVGAERGRVGPLARAGTSVPTTNFSVSLKNGAPGSSSTVRSLQAGANISNVVRPEQDRVATASVIAPSVSPIFGSNPNSNVQLGDSKTPSREMNSCTAMVAMVMSSRGGGS